MPPTTIILSICIDTLLLWPIRCQGSATSRKFLLRHLSSRNWKLKTQELQLIIKSIFGRSFLPTNGLRLHHHLRNGQSCNSNSKIHNNKYMKELWLIQTPGTRDWTGCRMSSGRCLNDFVPAVALKLTVTLGLAFSQTNQQANTTMNVYMSQQHHNKIDIPIAT